MCIYFGFIYINTNIYVNVRKLKVNIIFNTDESDIASSKPIKGKGKNHANWLNGIKVQITRQIIQKNPMDINWSHSCALHMSNEIVVVGKGGEVANSFTGQNAWKYLITWN